MLNKCLYKCKQKTQCEHSYLTQRVKIDSVPNIEIIRLHSPSSPVYVQIRAITFKLSMVCRYYIRNNMSTDTLVPDEMTGELLKDSQISFLSLNSAEIAAQLTLQDFHYFHEVEPTEYIDDLYELESKYGTPHLSRFSEVSS